MLALSIPLRDYVELSYLPIRMSYCVYDTQSLIKKWESEVKNVLLKRKATNGQ